MKHFVLILIVFFAGVVLGYGQTGVIRGHVYELESGDPVAFGNVILEGTDFGVNTDLDGFFSFAAIPAGDYKMIVSYIGFENAEVEVHLDEGQIFYKKIYLKENAVKLTTVDVSAKRQQARADVRVSKLSVTPGQIKSLPSTGGQADIAQYLAVLPGIVSTGDQGGQLYIRGGSPVQNKVLLDGMTIYNPFHSIGFFSVFETETIKAVDVMSGGFNADFGGRISAIVDIKTRAGNSKRYGGSVAVNPFQSKVLFEGPIKKDKGDGSAKSSFIFTAKHSYIDKTSPKLYPYAVDTTIFAGDDSGTPAEKKLPYNFTDFYGKLNFSSGQGSKIDFFGFNFNDKVNYEGVADLGWNSIGLGTNFKLIPPNSNIIIGGILSYSKYHVALNESEEFPRKSDISNYAALVDFSNYGVKSILKYGFEFAGKNTDFVFRNNNGITIKQPSFTTELAAFLTYKKTLGKLVIEPGVRVQSYASQHKTFIEPRFQAKLNATDYLRFKTGVGIYSQNLISSVNERDIINLFVGFLSGPEEHLYKPASTEKADHRLQKSVQAVFGMELDLGKYLELNVEPYYKDFQQLIAVNRDKRTPEETDFVTLTGKAYGVDVSLKYENKDMYVWATYSNGHVTRNDGVQEYPTIFDRRHNVNFLATYSFGSEKAWEASIRWNLGSGFPFTLTRGFYEELDLSDGVNTDVLTGNGDIGVVYDTKRNRGRLPYYHRLDASIKRTFTFSKHTKLETVISVTNVYDRKNIFYFDRVRYKRVNQLPILPSIGINFYF